MTQIIPSETNLLVERTPKTATKSGIILPEFTADQSIVEGKVLAVGPGKPLDNGDFREVPYKKGDIILFIANEYAKKEIDVEGKLCLILNERDVLAVVKK